MASALAEALAAVAKLDTGEKAEVAAALAREGYDGSQPMAGMEVEQGASDGSQRIAHAGEVEKTWVYDDDSGQQTLDKVWIEVLNDAEGNAGSDMFEFEFANQLKCGTEIKYEVNLTEMTITNLKRQGDARLGGEGHARRWLYGGQDASLPKRRCLEDAMAGRGKLWLEEHDGGQQPGLADPDCRSECSRRIHRRMAAPGNQQVEQINL